MRKWFGGAQAEAYPVHELDPTDTNREVFKKTLLEVYEGSDVGKQVQDPLSPDFDLTNARMFVVGEGDAVFALKGDDIVYAGKAGAIKEGGLKALAWPWYTAIGACLSLALGWLLTLVGFRSDSE